MHLRTNTVRRGSKTYRYARLVESYRKPDGMPAHRVIGNLGRLDDITITNIRTALAASRAGKTVRVGSSRRKASVVEVLANLHYLDIALLLALWRQAGLDAVLREALPKSEAEVPAEDVVLSLILHRCHKPGSKLAAQRWFPTTALPPLLDIPPERFVNSRVHRALELLEEGEQRLQESLGPSLELTEGSFVRFYVDATDTWFEGEGPELAERGKDKRGVFCQRVGIVMLCDARGFPLRWKTLSGRFHDGNSLLGMVDEVSALPWVQGRPIVLDRAVGNAGAVARLAASGLPYVTAVPVPEFRSCNAPIPWGKVARMQEIACEEQANLDRLTEECGLELSKNGRYLLDLGIFDKALPRGADVLTQGRLVALVVEELDKQSEGLNGSMRELAEKLGAAPRSLWRYTPLRALSPEIRGRLKNGDGDRLDFKALMRIAAAPPGNQPAVLEHENASATDKFKYARRHWKAARIPPLRSRAVLCFRPELCLTQREKEKQDHIEISTLIADINRRLAHPSNNRDEASAINEAMEVIRKRKLTDVLSVKMEKTDEGRGLRLTVNEQAQFRRRECHGIILIVTEPNLQGSAEQIASFFYDRDVIERDFRTIKSIVKLRPIHHQTDVKLRAHVTICMLALLLMRILEQNLQKAGNDSSAEAALELLGTVHLNTVRVDEKYIHTITSATDEQRRLLESLGMTVLLSDESCAPRGQ